MKEIGLILTGTFFLIVLYLLLTKHAAASSLLAGISNAYLAGVNELQTGTYRSVSVGG